MKILLVFFAVVPWGDCRTLYNLPPATPLPPPLPLTPLLPVPCSPPPPSPPTPRPLVQHIHAIEYTVTNTVPDSPGGKVFDEFIGAEFCLQIMPSIADFIFTVFEEKTVADRCDVAVVNLYITEHPGYAFKNGNQINVSASAIDEIYYPRENSKWLFYSVMVHEMTHVFQWHGNFGAPGGLTEGMADYVKVKSGYYDPATFTKPGEGDKWDQGYGVTARFLEYCDSLLPGFTAKFNKMMRYKYDDVYWLHLLGRPVDHLWRDYKTKYHT